MSASLIGRLRSSAYRLSTITVSRSLASTRFSSESAPGPSIMGSEDEVEQSLGRPCPTAGPSGHANSPHPSSRKGHQSTGLVELELPPIAIDPGGTSHATAASLAQRNSVPSTQMRCMITANRRASATIALFMPRCRAIFIAQALSQDHLVECTSMLWAAS